MTDLPLRTRGHDQAVSELNLLVLGDPDPNVRLAACRASGHIVASGDGETKKVMEMALADTDFRVREAAAAAIAKLVQVDERRLVHDEILQRSTGGMKTEKAIQKRLVAELTVLIKENIDLEIARERTFELSAFPEMACGHRIWSHRVMAFGKIYSRS